MSLFHRKKDLTRRRLTSADDRSSVSSGDVFRRNRTLVGTTSKNIDGINVSRSKLESPRTHVHHLALRRRKVLSSLIVILLSIAVLWLLVSNFTASPVMFQSVTPMLKNVNKSVYEKAIQDYLQANPISRFKFFLDEKSLTDYVTSKLPEVGEVSVKDMQQIGKMDYLVTMRKPVAGWVIKGRQYYVDSKGVSFEKNYFSEPVVQIVDNSGVPVQAGTTSVSKRFLGFVGRVVSESASLGHIVTKAVLPAGKTRELDISIKSISPIIRLSIDRPVGEQVEDMSRAVQYFSSNNQTPEYIDIRVSNKAFYK